MMYNTNMQEPCICYIELNHVEYMQVYPLSDTFYHLCHIPENV